VSNSIHASAIISPDAKLGDGNIIGPFVHIHAGVSLGNNNQLMTGAVVKHGVSLANDNVLHEYAVLGGEPQDLSFDDHISFVKIGSGNIFRENVTVHRSSKQGETTRVGDENFLMANVHIGHDCQLANHIVIAPATGLGGFVQVDDRAFISGGVMVHQFVRIGRLSMIGGNSKITQNALPFMTTDGNPAQVHGLNIVGLRRAGFNKSALNELKQAYAILLASPDALDAKLAKLNALSNEHVLHLSEFAATAKRGFHR